MKYFFKAFLSVLIVFSSFFSAEAQKDSVSSMIISIVPQYAFKNCFRLDIDKQLGLSRSWIVLSGQLYGGQILGGSYARTSLASDSSINDKDYIFGYGVELSYRLFLEKKNQGFYLMTGANYSHFDITYKEYSFQRETIEGENFYYYGRADEKQQIDRWMGTLGLGYQKSIKMGKAYRDYFLNYVIFDLYAGTSYRNAQIDDTLPGRRIYARNPWDYGVTGISPMFYFRVGFTVR